MDYLFNYFILQVSTAERLENTQILSVLESLDQQLRHLEQDGRQLEDKIRAGKYQ